MNTQTSDTDLFQRSTPDKVVGSALWPDKSSSGYATPERLALTTELQPDPTYDLVLPADLTVDQRAYLLAGIQGAKNTAKAYGSDLEQYRAFCAQVDKNPLPADPTLLGQYASHLASHQKWSTINRKLASIAKWHELHGHNSPMNDPWLKATLAGIARKHGTEPNQAKTFSIDTLKSVCRALILKDDKGVPCLVAMRDKVALTLGFLGAFRRSELVGLLVENICFNDKGFTISYYASKTNQRGKREDKAFIYSDEPALCPVRLLQGWLAQMNKTTGPLLVRVEKGNWLTNEGLSGGSIDRIVKGRIDDECSAHSLRASFVTVGKLSGAQDSEIMRQTGHKTEGMIRRYTRLDSIMEHNAVSKIGW